MDNLISDRRVRTTIYHVIAAGLVVATVWGLIEADTAEEVTKAVAALLGAGTIELAAANTPSEKSKYSDDSEGDDAEAELADAEGL